MSVVLVTGATSHLGVFAILEYLKNGYFVHATLRDISKKDSVLEMIAKTGAVSPEDMAKITLFECDLGSDDGWEEALEGCEYVCHVAYPFIIGAKYEDIEAAAVTGTMKLLEMAAKSETIKHFVYCSSFAAIGFGFHPEGTIVDDDFYSPEESPIVDGYAKSKIVVEKKMWQFIKSKELNPSGLTLTSICPYGITGPLPIGYTKYVGLISFMQMLYNGQMNPAPGMNFNVSDVRDIAKAFVKATEDPKVYNERFLFQDEQLFDAKEFLGILKEAFPEHTSKFPTEISDQSLTPPNLVTNKKARDLLDYRPYDSKKSIIESFTSFLQNEHIIVKEETN